MMDDFILEDLNINENIIDVNVVSYTQKKSIDDILKELVIKKTDYTPSLVEFIKSYSDKKANIYDKNKNEKYLPFWIIPVVNNKFIFGNSDSKNEKHRELIIELIQSIGQPDYNDKMANLTNFFMSIETEQGAINIKSKNDNSYINFSRDALGYIKNKLTLISPYRIHSSIYLLKYFYTELIQAKINRTGFHKDNLFYICNDDIENREFINIYPNNYNVEKYLKIPLTSSYLKSRFLSKSINKCSKAPRKLEKFIKDICFIDKNNIDDYLNTLIKNLFKGTKYVKNYYDILKIYRYFDLNTKSKTVYNNKIVNMLLNIKPNKQNYYTDLIFIPDNESFIYNETWEKIKHLYNNLDFTENIHYTLFNSNDKGNYYYAYTQVEYDENELNFIINKILNYIEVLKKDIINIDNINELQDNIEFKNAMLTNTRLIFYNDQLYIVESNGAIDLFDNYKTKLSIHKLNIYLDHLQKLKKTNNEYLIDIESAEKKLIINNLINSKFKQYRINETTIGIMPFSELLCYIRSNDKYRNIKYLNKLFYIDINDRCILYETGEDLWCKHELYNQDEFIINENDILKCKYCGTIFENKIDKMTGFIGGRPNLIQSGELNSDQNYLSLIINQIFLSFKKVQDEYKIKLRNLLDIYYIEFNKIYSLLSQHSVNNVELLKKINITYFERAGKAFNIYKQKNPNDKLKFEFSDLENTDNYIKHEKISLFFAMQYFYIFNDIITTMIAIYEIIMNSRTSKNTASNWSSFWLISFLNLDKKYNYKYFEERYYIPLNKDEIKLKYNNLFKNASSNLLNMNININNLYKIGNLKYNNYYLNNLIREDINPNYKEFINYSIIGNNLINYDKNIVEYSIKIMQTKLLKLNYNNDNSEYYITPSNVINYDSLSYNDRNLNWYVEPSLCITGLYITENNLLYSNYDFKKDIKNLRNINNKTILLTYLDHLNQLANININNTNFKKEPEILLDNNKYTNYIRYNINKPIKQSLNHTILLKELNMNNMTMNNFKKLYNTNINPEKITKKDAKNIISNVYLYKYIQNIVSYFNNIKINDFKNNQVIAFGDFINNVNNNKKLKKRKNELNDMFIKNKHFYKSIEINNNNNIQVGYEIKYKTNYTENVDNNVAQVLKLIGLERKIDKNISINKLNKDENSILKQFNFENIKNNIYKSWYYQFAYLAGTIINSKIKTNTPSDISLFQKGYYISDLYKYNTTFNNLNIANLNLRYKYIFQYKFKELKRLFNHFKEKDFNYNVQYDNIYYFINTLYKNALLCELHTFIISICGVSLYDGGYEDISGKLYMNNKENVDKINSLYKVLFEHFNLTLNSLEPLYVEYEHQSEEYKNKKYGKNKNKNDIFIRTGYDEEEEEELEELEEILDNEAEKSGINEEDIMDEEADDFFVENALIDEDINENEEDEMYNNIEELVINENNELDNIQPLIDDIIEIDLSVDEDVVL